MEAELDINALITNLNSVDDSNIPPWALLLIESMKGLFTIFKSYNKLSQRVEKLESLNSVCENNTTLLHQENKRLNDLVINLETKVDDQEQSSRSACLLIHGMEERDKEDTDDIALDIFNNELGLDIGKDHIQRSHRLGPKRIGRNTRTTKATPRPIILRFTSYRQRSLVFRSKKLLKGKPVSITENLTQTRYHLLNAAKAKLGRGNVWSSDGRIMTKIDDRYLVIHTSEDLDNLYASCNDIFLCCLNIEAVSYSRDRIARCRGKPQTSP